MREGVLRASRHTSGRGVHVGQKVQCRLLEVLGQIGSHSEDLDTVDGRISGVGVVGVVVGEGCGV